jgi:hypothetical protein
LESKHGQTPKSFFYGILEDDFGCVSPTIKMASPFEDKYPNIDRWINEHEGWIEVGYDVDSPLNSFIRALDQGGMSWEGRSSYSSLDEAFQDLDDALAEVLRDIYGE